MTELRDLTHIKAVPGEQARRDGRQRKLLRTYLPELVQLERLLADAPAQFSARVEGRVQVQDLEAPIYRVEIGKAPADAPALLLVGGVHGLERIGTQVCGAPCWDPSFRCADLLVLLDVERLASRYARKYMRH